jgi:hypothetical protein
LRAKTHHIARRNQGLTRRSIGQPRAAISFTLATFILVFCVVLASPVKAAKSKSHKSKSHQSAERNLDASFTLELGPAETTLPATQTITLFVPNGVRDAGAKLPACNPNRLENEGVKACPKGSQVGSGQSDGYTLGVVEPLTLTMFNGPGASLLVYVVGLSPVSIQVVVTGAITHPAGNIYGQQLAFTIPHGLLEPLPEDQAWLLSLHTHLDGKVGWLRSTSCPPHGWSLKAQFGYTNGQMLTVGANLTCV